MSRYGVAASVLTLALAGGLLQAPATASPEPVGPAAQVDAPVPVLAWGPCDEAPDDVFECATATVPLDYDEPLGETLEIDVLRVPATDPGDRIGSLFVNPGGPGGSSRFFATYFGEAVPDVVSERFDIVGVDPRGVGPSSEMRCRSEGKPPAYPRAFFPMNDRQVRDQIAFDRWQREACATDPEPVVAHMSTADTARDMDLVRQALGEELLTYYGISYGTQLGSTYAAMFPDRIRAMIVDGVLDPEEWTTGHGDADTRPFSERLGSGYGAWQGLTAAFAECDRVGPRRCPLAGRASQTWTEVVHRLRRGPFDGIRYSDVVGFALGSLYDARSVKPFLRELRRLHAVMFEGASHRLGRWDPAAAHRRSSDRRGIPGPYSTSADFGYARVFNSFAGVACADSDNPTRERTWEAAGKRADRRSPWFGRAWTWASGVCASWPEVTKEDRFAGPFAATTSAPVLVVGNTYDPATPLHGARAVNRLLEGSRLLVLDGWGHGALATGPCIDEAFAAYLVEGTLPPAGTVCRPARELFPR